MRQKPQTETLLVNQIIYRLRISKANIYPVIALYF